MARFVVPAEFRELRVPISAELLTDRLRRSIGAEAATSYALGDRTRGAFVGEVGENTFRLRKARRLPGGGFPRVQYGTLEPFGGATLVRIKSELHPVAAIGLTIQLVVGAILALLSAIAALSQPVFASGFITVLVLLTGLTLIARRSGQRDTAEAIQFLERLGRP